MDDILEEALIRMDDAVEALQREFATVRTGKAVPAILDTVRVEAYGGLMPLNQVATVAALDASLLVVQPFDRSVIGEIEKAIRASGLGLNPSNDGAVVRVPIPPLSEERRREYVRLLHRMAENGRVSVRRARQVANDAVKRALKASETGEDAAHRAMGEIQKLTVEYGGKIDAILAAKEVEVMAI